MSGSPGITMSAQSSRKTSRHCSWAPSRYDPEKALGSHNRSLRLRLQMTFHCGQGWYLWRFLNILFSFGSCAIFVTTTYDTYRDDVHLRTWDQASSCYFIIDFGFSFFIAFDRVKFWHDWGTYLDIVSLISVVPIDGTSFVAVLRVFRVLTYTLRATSQRGGSLLVTLFAVVVGLMSMLFMFSGLVWCLSSQIGSSFYDAHDDINRSLRFHEALYFVMVTVSTVGYGDITPASPVSQMLMVVMLPVAVTAFAIAMTIIQTKARKLARSHSDRHRHYECPVGWRHVVMCGDLSDSTMSRICHQIFNNYGDARRVESWMVLLSKTPPSEMQEQLVQEHSQLDYICGNPLSLYDLNRASVSSAFLTVVLARSAFGDCGDAKSADCEATHMAFAIRQHCPNARVLVRLNHSAFQEDLNERWISTAVSCTLRCSLVALNTLHPGAGTVLSSLLSAAPSHKEWFAEQRQLEFTHGLEFELYPCTVPASAAGLTLRQFQLDLRQYHMTYVALYCTSSGSKQLLGVPPETTLHAGDCVWLMARSWQEVASLDQKYSSRGSEELILQDKAVPRLQDVRPSAALTRGAPTAGLPVPSRKEQLLPLQLASQVLATAVDQMVELASSDPGGRVQAIATQLEQLRADLPELPQQNPEAPTFDVVVCALSYESWMLELVDALREAAANPSLSVQLLLSELPPAHVMVGISARRVVVHNADFGSMAGIQQTNVAQAKRVIVATSSESDSAQIHVLASRISELLLKSGLEGQHLTVDVNSATMEEVVFLRHDPWCDHSRDPVTLPSMSDCANLGNKIFATQLSGENTEPIYSKLSYEYASGCLHAPWVLDTFLAHSIVQPSLVTLLSALIGIQDWCGSSVGEDDDWQEDLEKVSNNQRIQRVLIPDQHVTVYTSYGTLFNACWCLYNVVPLGMFRKASHSCSADQGYVFINPRNDAEVNRGDHLYVVAPIGFSFPLEAPTLF